MTFTETAAKKQWLQPLLVAVPLIIVALIAWGATDQKINNIEEHLGAECHLTTCEEIARLGERVSSLERGQTEIKATLIGIQDILIERLPRL